MNIIEIIFGLIIVLFILIMINGLFKIRKEFYFNNHK